MTCVQKRDLAKRANLSQAFRAVFCIFFPRNLVSNSVNILCYAAPTD